MPPAREHLVLFNPSAGGGRSAALLPEIETALRAHGLEHRVLHTTSLRHGVEQARAAVEQGAQPVVVSGDGLIGAIGGVLAGTETPLAIVPGGRGNDFARAMRIPTDPDAAVALIAAGETRRIDIGQANDRPFLCIASLGFDSDANRIANEARLIKGRLVYAYAGIRALIGWRPAQFEVSIDGRSHDFQGYSIAVGNTSYYGGGMNVTPSARPDDGRLDVVMTRQTSKLRFFRGLPEVFKGVHVERPEVREAYGREVVVDADRSFDVYADGEQITTTPVTIKVHPGALNVCAPAG